MALSEDAKAIAASNLTVALAVLIAAGWGVADKGSKHPEPRIIIDDWFEEWSKHFSEN